MDGIWDIYRQKRGEFDAWLAVTCKAVNIDSNTDMTHEKYDSIFNIVIKHTSHHFVDAVFK
jgi:hypothetical protein